MEDTRVNRRAVLGTIGAGVASATVWANTGESTDDPSPRIKRDTELSAAVVDDQQLRRELVTTHAASVLGTLQDGGVLSAGADAFDFTTFDSDRAGIPAGTDFEGTAATTVSGESDDVTLLMASTQTDGRQVNLFVKPETDDSYAIVSPIDGNRAELYREDGLAGVDDPDGPLLYCLDSTQCTSRCTDCVYGSVVELEETFHCFACEDDDGSQTCCCEVVSAECSCSLECDSGGDDPTLTRETAV